MQYQGTSLITWLRHAPRSVAVTACVVKIAFVMMVLAPSAQAARAEMTNAEIRSAQVQRSPEAKLSVLVLEVSEQAKRWQREAEYARKKQGVYSLSKRALSDRNRLVEGWRDQLEELDKQVWENFKALDQHIKKHQLAPVIQERQDEMKAHYKREMAGFRKLLKQHRNMKSTADGEAMTKAITGFLDGKQLKRSQQPFDPNNLPNVSLQPDHSNTPKMSKAEFIAAGLHDTPYVQLAQAGSDFTFSNLPDADDPAFLSETDEVTLTDFVREKAAELEHDPVKIYNWVRNNIEWLPTWGAVQNADVTLGSQRGNAFDIASLLIALLRASGIPSRYVHGTIEVPIEEFKNWAGGFENADSAWDFISAGGIPSQGVTSGGTLTKMRLEHIWVEAAVDYEPSRGAKNQDADTWVSLDASFKQYEVRQGVDYIARSGVDLDQVILNFAQSGTVNESESWVSSQSATDIDSARLQFETVIQDDITGPELPIVGDLVGGLRLEPIIYKQIPSALSSRIVFTGARYAEIPNSLRQWMTFGFGRSSDGVAQLSIRLSWARVNNQKISLDFNPVSEDDENVLSSLIPADINSLSDIEPFSVPSHLVRMQPRIMIDDEPVLTGSSIRLGEEVDFVFDTTVATGEIIPRTYSVVAGSSLALAAFGGGVSLKSLRRAQLGVAESLRVIGDPDASASDLSSHILDIAYHAGLLSYFSQYINLSYIYGLPLMGKHSMLAGVGSYGYEPDVTTFFGFPRSIQSGVLAFNIIIVSATVVDNSSAARNITYRNLVGLISSALEYGVSDQMFLPPNVESFSISSVSGLRRALDSNQRIYLVNSDNVDSVIASLALTSETVDEIRLAVLAGHEVTVHASPIEGGGWVGAAYIILDPDSGSGAYRITGGLKGGIFSLEAASDAIEVTGALITALKLLEDLANNSRNEDLLLTILGGALTAVSEAIDSLLYSESRCESLDDYSVVLLEYAKIHADAAAAQIAFLDLAENFLGPPGSLLVKLTGVILAMHAMARILPVLNFTQGDVAACLS